MRATVVFALLLLAGCPQKPAREPQPNPPAVPAPDGAQVTPGALPAGWPEEIAVYPGAVIKEGRRAQNNGQPVLTAFLTTGDQPEAVVAFYGKEASLRKFTVVSSSQVPGEAVSLYRRGEQTLAVSTRRDEAAQLTEVELTVAGVYDQGVGAPSARASETKQNPPSENQRRPGSQVPEHPLMPVYPGAVAEDPTFMNGAIQRRMTSNHELGQVEAYYSDFYAAQGFRQDSRVELGSQVTLAYSGQRGSVSLNLMQSTDSSGDPATRITLTFSGGSSR